MIQKKICMVGSFAVGKTALIRQFVESVFSEDYKTTLGVKIEKKIITIEGNDVKLMIWDLAGEDEFISVRSAYLRGSSGLMYIMDGTRADTLNTVFELDEKFSVELNSIPKVLLINKHDLEDKWMMNADHYMDLTNKGWIFYNTSAKNGENIEDAFKDLWLKMMDH